MGLKPEKTTIAAQIPVILKWFEYYTGGFSLVTTNLRDGVTLPAGSMFKIDEATRQAVPIKTAKAVANSTAGQTSYVVADAAYFKVGDLISAEGGTSRVLKRITASGENWILGVSTNIGTAVATGEVLFEPTSATNEAAGVGSGEADTISVFDYKVGETSLQQFLTLLRRGTVYKNRMQPHLAGHISELPATIQLSKSY